MARIAGVDIPRDRRVVASLPVIYGIGPTNAQKILDRTNISPDKRRLVDDAALFADDACRSRVCASSFVSGATGRRSASFRFPVSIHRCT